MRISDHKKPVIIKSINKRFFLAGIEYICGSPQAKLSIEGILKKKSRIRFYDDLFFDIGK